MHSLSTERTRPLPSPVSAKIKRTLKAAGVVGLVGIGALFVARPFVQFGPAEAPLDSALPSYVDLEAERSTWAEQIASDSELEDRAARPIENHVQVGSGDTLMDVLTRAGVEISDANQAIDALKEVYNP